MSLGNRVQNLLIPKLKISTTFRYTFDKVVKTSQTQALPVTHHRTIAWKGVVSLSLLRIFLKNASSPSKIEDLWDPRA